MRPLIWYWWDVRNWLHYAWHERLPWALAWWVPRKVALFVFVRVMCADMEHNEASVLGTDVYSRVWASWVAGKGR